MHKKQTILVGLTGSLHSMASAYLLKKQGHKVIGISVVFNDLKDPIPYLEDWKALNLEFIKEGAEKLGIPFYAVNAIERFKSQILDSMVGARLSGIHFSYCAQINKLLSQILCEKAQKLKADMIVTGHFAKIQSHVKLQLNKIYSYLDPNLDQSEDLVFIKREILNKMYFPMGDLRYQDVLNIMRDSFANFFPETLDKNQNIMLKESFPLYVELNSSSNFWHVEEKIYNYQDDFKLAIHKGIHHFYIGKSEIEGDGSIVIDKALKVVDINLYTGNVYLDFSENLKTTILQISDFYQHQENVSFARRAYIKFKGKKERFPCFVEYKNNNMVNIELEDLINDLIPEGLLCTLYGRRTGRSELIGGGLCKVSGIMGINHFLPFPYKDPYDLEEDVLFEDEDEEYEKKQEKSQNITFNF